MSSSPLKLFLQSLLTNQVKIENSHLQQLDSTSDDSDLSTDQQEEYESSNFLIMTIVFSVYVFGFILVYIRAKDTAKLDKIDIMTLSSQGIYITTNFLFSLFVYQFDPNINQFSEAYIYVFIEIFFFGAVLSLFQRIEFNKAFLKEGKKYLQKNTLNNQSIKYRGLDMMDRHLQNIFNSQMESSYKQLIKLLFVFFLVSLLVLILQLASVDPNNSETDDSLFYYFMTMINYSINLFKFHISSQLIYSAIEVTEKFDKFNTVIKELMKNSKNIHQTNCVHHNNIEDKIFKQAQHQTHLNIKYNLYKLLGWVLIFEVLIRDMQDVSTLNMMMEYGVSDDVLTEEVYDQSIRQMITWMLNVIIVLIVQTVTFFYSDDLQVELLYHHQNMQKCQCLQQFDNVIQNSSLDMSYQTWNEHSISLQNQNNVSYNLNGDPNNPQPVNQQQFNQMSMDRSFKNFNTNTSRPDGQMIQPQQQLQNNTMLSGEQQFYSLASMTASEQNPYHQQQNQEFTNPYFNNNPQHQQQQYLNPNQAAQGIGGSSGIIQLQQIDIRVNDSSISGKQFGGQGQSVRKRNHRSVKQLAIQSQINQVQAETSLQSYGQVQQQQQPHMQQQQQQQQKESQGGSSRKKMVQNIENLQTVQTLDDNTGATQIQSTKDILQPLLQ